MVLNGTNGTPVGEGQRILLILEIALSERGSWLSRVLTIILWLSTVFRCGNNFVLVVSIGRQRALRELKQYALMAYMALFDLLDGCKYFCLVTFDYGVRSRLDCLLTFRSLWYLLGTQSSVFILVLVSIDRMLSVLFPYWYWKQTGALSHKLGVCAFGWTCIMGCYLVWAPLKTPAVMVPHCYTTHTFTYAFEVENNIRRGLLLLSVIIYVVVWVLFIYRGKLRLAKVANQSNTRAELNAQLKRHHDIQRAATITLGWSAVITLCMHIVPYTAFTWLRKSFPSLQQYGWMMFVPMNISSSANMFLFAKRHEEVKSALVAMLRFKRMPGNIKDWQMVRRNHINRETNPVHGRY